MDTNVYFDYIDTNGIIKKAEVLCCFELEKYSKQYALCAIPSDDGFDLCAFIISEKGNEVSMEDIEDDEEYREVSRYVNELTEDLDDDNESEILGKQDNYGQDNEDSEYDSKMLNDKTYYQIILNDLLSKVEKTTSFPKIDILTGELKDKKLQKRYLKAISCYGEIINNELPLLLCDETIASSGKKGFVLFSNCIFTSYSKYQRIRLTDINNVITEDLLVKLIMHNGEYVARN